MNSNFDVSVCKGKKGEYKLQITQSHKTNTVNVIFPKKGNFKKDIDFSNLKRREKKMLYYTSVVASFWQNRCKKKKFGPFRKLSKKESKIFSLFVYETRKVFEKDDPILRTRDMLSHPYFRGVSFIQKIDLLSKISSGLILQNQKLPKSTKLNFSTLCIIFEVMKFRIKKEILMQEVFDILLRKDKSAEDETTIQLFELEKKEFYETFEKIYNEPIEKLFCEIFLKDDSICGEEKENSQNEIQQNEQKNEQDHPKEKQLNKKSRKEKEVSDSGDTQDFCKIMIEGSKVENKLLYQNNVGIICKFRSLVVKWMNLIFHETVKGVFFEEDVLLIQVWDFWSLCLDLLLVKIFNHSEKSLNKIWFSNLDYLVDPVIVNRIENTIAETRNKFERNFVAVDWMRKSVLLDILTTNSVQAIQRELERNWSKKSIAAMKIFWENLMKNCNPSEFLCFSYRYSYINSLKDEELYKKDYFFLSKEGKVKKNLFLYTSLRSICSNCLKVHSKLFRCTGCKSVVYCSRNCQKQNFSRHKPLCKVSKVTEKKFQCKFCKIELLKKNVMFCGKCFSTTYCSREHQIQDWIRHRNNDCSKTNTKK